MSSKEVINRINVITMILERKREALRHAEDLSVMLYQDEEEFLFLDERTDDSDEAHDIEVKVSAGQAVDELIETLGHQCLKMELELVKLNKAL